MEQHQLTRVQNIQFSTYSNAIIRWWILIDIISREREATRKSKGKKCVNENEINGAQNIDRHAFSHSEIGSIRISVEWKVKIVLIRFWRAGIDDSENEMNIVHTEYGVQQRIYILNSTLFTVITVSLHFFFFFFLFHFVWHSSAAKCIQEPFVRFECKPLLHHVECRIICIRSLAL